MSNELSVLFATLFRNFRDHIGICVDSLQKTQRLIFADEAPTCHKDLGPAFLCLPERPNRIPPKSFDFKNRSVPAVARAGGAPSDARAHLDIDRMTASMDVTELSPTALAAEDARPSLDDVLGFRSAQKPSFEDGIRRENEATTTRADSRENEEDACVANDTQDDVAPCCQRTGPCAWDAVCRTHVRRWETAHGEAYLGFLRRTGGVVPAWLRSAEDGGDVLPGQRGSAAAVATKAYLELEAYASDENDDEASTGLLGNGGDDALVEVAGRGEADGEPTPFGADSVMDLDDDDDDASAFENPVLAEAMARGSDARAEAAGALRLDETAGLEA